MADSAELVTAAAVNYLAVDYDVGHAASELTNVLNSYGANGWYITNVQLVSYNKRRAVFMQAGPTEYLVIDYDVGKSAETLTSDLNSYGAGGWQLSSVDLIKQNKRRVIFTKGGDAGSGGSFPEAPQDGLAYGRSNAAWAQVVPVPALLDGGTF
jgi:hypothetical protein